MSFWKKVGDALKFGAKEAVLGPLYTFGVVDRPSTGNAKFDKLLGNKDVVGKLMGSLVGADQVSKGISNKTNMSGSNVSSLFQGLGSTFSGGVKFGGESTKSNWLPFAIIGAIVLIVVIRPLSTMFTTRKRRR